MYIFIYTHIEDKITQYMPFVQNYALGSYVLRTAFERGLLATGPLSHSAKRCNFYLLKIEIDIKKSLHLKENSFSKPSF